MVNPRDIAGERRRRRSMAAGKKCLSRSVPEIHSHVAGDVKQPTNQQLFKARDLVWLAESNKPQKKANTATAHRCSAARRNQRPHTSLFSDLMFATLHGTQGPLCKEPCSTIQCPEKLYLVCVGWLVGCLTSQQQASVSQGRICTDNFTCCHTEIEVAHPTFHLTQSQYTDTGQTSPSADPITPGAWLGSHWSASFKVTGMTRSRKNPAQAGFEAGIFRSGGGRLTTRPTRRYASRVTDKSQGKVNAPVPRCRHPCTLVNGSAN